VTPPAHLARAGSSRLPPRAERFVPPRRRATGYWLTGTVTFSIVPAVRRIRERDFGDGSLFRVVQVTPPGVGDAGLEGGVVCGDSTA